MKPSKELIQRVEEITGSKPVTWNFIAKGYTVAERYVVKLGNGSSVFTKLATDQDTIEWIKNEYKIYGNLQAEFLPKLVGWDDGKFPLLVLEDLSSGVWPPPWSKDQIARVLNTLKKVATTLPPQSVPPLRQFAENLVGWREIAKDPSGFLGLGLVSSEWLNKALPALTKAEESANLEGNALVHTDVRSDNICFLGRRTLLIDWNWASRGNPKLDLISWLPSLYSEGGPPPWEITLEEPELVAAVAGYFAFHAYRPPHKQGPAIRQLQLVQLKATLPWACKALGLTMP